ncbi:ABC transporter ATP-binding protein [Brevibacillus invocatus]|uniref:ABC transporter ATP-binding protein n=1 Tax=Brevibacillus invocatus TaxID=173959 RepID=UPI00203D1F98|nr:ABC transporter ATP-binding protein [Brevibacillus invocatus]MCM3080675.1 ABC transporter ATP-binding protein [Brevibacillus invocatus]MCM3431256.1 ABC transporter ATP-binding protein [Brevibacillus invocatus]
MSQLLDLQHVTVDFQSKNGLLTAIRDVSLQIKAGETVCLVGESGSGKTITSKAIMRLIDYEHGQISEGNIVLDGVNLTKLSQHELRGLRGKKMAMIFQEPMAAFDPVFTIGNQIMEAILEHQQVKKDVAWKQAIHLLERVGIPEPALRMKQYPNELSGGMLQRAMIAMALACGPELLIADEPTTALDVTIQSQILQLLQELKAEYQMSILLITHDMGIAAEMADRIIVMYAGRVVEQATSEQLFEKPHHPYTRGLLRSITTIDSHRGSRLFSIEGSIPHLADMPSGCRFHPRCAYATQKCLFDEPPLSEINGRLTSCWHADQLVESDDWIGKSEVEPQVTVMEPKHDENKSALQRELLLDVKGLSKAYPVGKGLLQRASSLIRAVDDVSFTIEKGETFGLVGESGSGKSTLGRVLLQLEKASKGSIRFQGLELTQLKTAELQKVRRDMQVIFQDPYGSVNPRWQIGDIIGEPLMVHEDLDATVRRERVEALLEAVGLKRGWYERYPHEFSGGQRQRIGIARAIALNPSFVLADEAVSALDVSVQAQIVNLMQDLQRDLGLTYLFIAHGLHIVRHISDRIGVMYLGKLVEIAASEELFLHPAHHYTKGLIASIPVPDPKQKREPFSLQGEIPSPANPPSGCRFHTRCPAATARCKEEPPAWQEIQRGHWVACHHPA